MNALRTAKLFVKRRKVIDLQSIVDGFGTSRLDMLSLKFKNDQ